MEKYASMCCNEKQLTFLQYFFLFGAGSDKLNVFWVAVSWWQYCGRQFTRGII